jgi:hypothetical protein
MSEKPIPVDSLRTPPGVSRGTFKPGGKTPFDLTWDVVWKKGVARRIRGTRTPERKEYRNDPGRSL